MRHVSPTFFMVFSDWCKTALSLSSTERLLTLEETRHSSVVSSSTILRKGTEVTTLPFVPEGFNPYQKVFYIGGLWRDSAVFILCKLSILISEIFFSA